MTTKTTRPAISPQPFARPEACWGQTYRLRRIEPKRPYRPLDWLDEIAPALTVIGMATAVLLGAIIGG